MSSHGQIIEHMHMEDPDSFRQRLRLDDMEVMRTFRDLISTEDGQQAVLSLKTKQSDAEGILNLIDRVSDQQLIR